MLNFLWGEIFSIDESLDENYTKGKNPNADEVYLYIGAEDLFLRIK